MDAKGKGVAGVVVESKPSKVEGIKVASQYLKTILAEEVAADASHISEDAATVLKFHGIHAIGVYVSGDSVIRLSVGGSEIDIEDASIKLSNGGSSIKITSGAIDIVSGGTVTISGAVVDVKGAPIKLNC